MRDTDAKANPESEQAKEPLASRDEATSETSSDLGEFNLGPDFELDEDDLKMLFALGLC